MDAQIKNPGGELAENIKKSESEPQHRFELQDPHMETKYRFPTAAAATAEADRLGFVGVTSVSADGKYSQVLKREGEWRVATLRDGEWKADGKTIAEIQAENDSAALKAIEERAALREAAGQGVSAETDKAMAIADAHAFRRIQGAIQQQDAAVTIASTARENPEYKNSLDKAIPGYPGTADKAYALDAANTDKVMAKEERKAAEFASMVAERNAAEGAKELVEAISIALGASYSDDSQVRSAETAQARRLEADAYKKLAAVDVAQAKALVAAERNSVGDDGQLKASIRLDEAKLAAAVRELNANTDKVMPKEERKAAEFASMVAERNTVEPNIEKAAQRLEGDEEAKRSAWLKKTDEAKAAQPDGKAKAASDNQVESDEIFTASQPDVRPAVPPEVEKKYLRVGDKFYYPNNTEQAAFEDKGNKLETKSNSENVAESMVRIAEARGWDEIKVSGTETFRKEVWLEAASRGMHVKGYAPSEQDKAELAKRTRDLDPKVEKENKPFRARENDEETTTPSQRRASAFANETPAEAVKLHPELAGAAAVLAATAKQAEADGLNPAQRAIVSARVRQNVVNSIERGELPEVKIKDEVEVKQDRREEREATR